MASESSPVRRPRPWFNRWEYEPVILFIPLLLSVLLILGAFWFVELESWIGTTLAVLVVVVLIAVFVTRNAMRLQGRERRERSP